MAAVVAGRGICGGGRVERILRAGICAGPLNLARTRRATGPLWIPRLFPVGDVKFACKFRPRQRAQSRTTTTTTAARAPWLGFN